MINLHNMFDDQATLLIHLSAILILSLLSFIFSGPDVLTISFIAFLVLYVYYKQLKKLQQENRQLQQNRAKWLYQIIGSTNTRGKIGEFYIQQLTNHDISSQIRNNELGFSGENQEYIFIPPDLEKAETELVKTEERASIIIGITVFIPVLFALLHLFRFVPLFPFILELYTGVLLAMLVATNQRRQYELEGWDDAISILRDKKQEISTLGRKALPSIPYFQNSTANSLGLNLQLDVSSPAEMFTAGILQATAQVPIDDREYILDQLIDQLMDMPKQQQLVQTRWEALKVRVLLITSVGVAISALLATIAFYAVPTLSNNLVQLQSTQNLLWGQFLLTISINLIVINNWLEKSKLYLVSVMWTLVYLLIVVIGYFIYS